MLRKAAPGDPFAQPPVEQRPQNAEEYSEAEREAPAEGSLDARLSAEGSGSGNIVTRESRSQSVIDAQTSFDGRFESGMDLVVLGSISGEVICRGLLTIERDATAKAKIEARDAHVRGRIEGDIVCSGRLVLAASANVNGTIKAAALVVEEGATIRGSVETVTMAAGEIAASATPRTTVQRKPPVEGAPAAEEPAAGNGTAATRWTGRREVPTFALVSSDERTGRERN